MELVGRYNQREVRLYDVECGSAERGDDVAAGLGLRFGSVGL